MCWGVGTLATRGALLLVRQLDIEQAEQQDAHEFFRLLVDYLVSANAARGAGRYDGHAEGNTVSGYRG
eukprot:gene4351-biopygen456